MPGQAGACDLREAVGSIERHRAFESGEQDGLILGPLHKLLHYGCAHALAPEPHNPSLSDSCPLSLWGLQTASLLPALASTCAWRSKRTGVQGVQGTA